MKQPQPLPPPFTIPQARITSILTCPNPNCGRTIYSPTIRVGEVWMKCNVAEKHRRGGCPAHWLNLTLAPRSTGHTLASLIGFWPTVALLQVIMPGPWVVPSDTVLAIQLSSDDTRPVHVQVTCRARDEHHLRYATVADILMALHILKRTRSPV